jgi:putative cell wall-binding protein
VVTLDNVRVNHYQVTGERIKRDILTYYPKSALYAHETGHMLGLPDLYNTLEKADGTNAAAVNVGQLSIMGNNWAKRSGDSDFDVSPTHLDPWCKAKLGFYTPITLSSPTTISLYPASNRANYKIYKIPTTNPKEYYLIEARTQTGFDAALYRIDGDKDSTYLDVDGGVVVWHIDENEFTSTFVVNDFGHTPGIMPVYREANERKPFRTSTYGKRFDAFNNEFTTSGLWDNYQFSDFTLTASVTNSQSPYTVSVQTSTLLPVKRYSGSSRMHTALLAYRDQFPNGAQNIVLAPSHSFPDALTASALAKKLNGPILLTEQGALDPAVAAAINESVVQKVYIIGGTSVISQAIQNTITQNYGKTVQRLGGSSRYETAKLVALQVLTTSTNTVFLVNGANFPDGLSAGSASAQNGYPILYAEQGATTLPADTASILSKPQITKVIIVGGSAVIPTGITSAITACNISSSNITRIVGSDRYETNLLVQKQFFPNAQSGFAASGESFPDALAGSPLAGKLGYPLFLVPASPQIPSANIVAHIKDKSFQSLTIMGGSSAVSIKAEMRLRTILPY